MNSQSYGNLVSSKYIGQNLRHALNHQGDSRNRKQFLSQKTLPTRSQLNSTLDISDNSKSILEIPKLDRKIKIVPKGYTKMYNEKLNQFGNAAIAQRINAIPMISKNTINLQRNATLETFSTQSQKQIVNKQNLDKLMSNSKI